MKLRKIICFGLILTAIQAVSAQQSDSQEFKPSGQIIVRTFLDYGAGIGNTATPNNNSISGFDVTRAFLGYNYDITPTWSAQIIIDAAAGRVSDPNLSTKGYYQPSLRTAFIDYHGQGFNVSFGQVGVQQFSTPESYWGHRYLAKSFMDLNHFGQPVDLGISAQYTFNKFVSVDAAITNGEGYKLVNGDNRNRYGMGVKLTPIRGLMVRLYGDMWTAPQGDKYKDQSLYTGSVGYKANGYIIGAEYDYLANVKWAKDQDSHGYSIYGTVPVAKKWNVFARYDNLSSTDHRSTAGTDGQRIIAGVEFNPVKNIKLSPNVQNFNPESGIAATTVYMSVDFKL